MNNRVVFDTNVLVSALLFEHSKPAQAVFSVVRDGTMLVSLATLQELSGVLRRKKFDRYLTIDEREEFLTRLMLTASLIEINEPIQVCRDPQDDKFLEVAINGQATAIVSGDDDLLVLHPFRGIPIVTPDTFIWRNET